ncbi:von Willebrand factor [Drosophila innubila]|uniref:von Willebrand factor n=1 Tax=Drosophila innubila TaxID=198719 RepID=UPI00148C6E27|nr:von Willebrand factor [Drosophila innubila]
MKLSAAILGVVFLKVTTAHLNAFLGECRYNDVKVDCMPPCPRICMSHLLVRKCKAVECTPGCACPEGWVRKASDTGPCIKRSSCKRWIV